jgi:hypothetical protein
MAYVVDVEYVEDVKEIVDEGNVDVDGVEITEDVATED